MASASQPEPRSSRIRARNGLLVERRHHAPIRADALGDRDPVAAAHQRSRRREGRIVDRLLEPAPILQLIAEAGSGEKTHPAARPLDHHVGGDGRAVHDPVGAGQQVGELQPEAVRRPLEALSSALGLRLAAGRHLQVEGPLRPRDDDIRERPAHVDPDLASLHRDSSAMSFAMRA